MFIQQKQQQGFGWFNTVLSIGSKIVGDRSAKRKAKNAAATEVAIVAAEKVNQQKALESQIQQQKEQVVQEQKKAKSNTIMYIGLGVGALTIATGAYFLLKKRG